MASDSSTAIIDGVEVRFETGIDQDGKPTRTVIVPLITPARQDQNGNDTADIPLRTLPDGAPSLMAHLPVGYGLRMEGLQDAQPIASAVALLTAQIEARVPTAGQASMIEQISQPSRWILETLPFVLSTIVPSVGPGGATAPIRLVANLNLVQSNIVLIDTNGQGDAVHLALDGFKHTLITGAGTFEQVPGRANIVADGANQTIVIDGSGDRVSTGGGADRIIVGQSTSDGFSHFNFNDIDGGEGRDTVQLSGASRGGHHVYAYHDGTGGAHIMLTNMNQLWVSHRLQHIEVLQFAEASADTSERGSVTRLYESLLDRTPDAAGLDSWMRALAGAASLEDVTLAILESAELAGQVPQADQAYVAWLYTQVLGRAPDADGLTHWTAALASGDISRAQLALALVDSGEKLQADASNQLDFGASDVGVLIRLYDALYDRAPDLDGLNFWINRSEAGVSLADIADGFVAGDEATAGLDDTAFLEHVYRTALERAATATELADWSGLLAQGYVDRGDVLLALAESAEMVALVGQMSTSFEVI